MPTPRKVTSAKQKGPGRTVLESKKAKKAEDPLQNDSQVKKFWALVVEGVPYSQFIGLEPPLKVNRFQEIRTLVILDRFWDLSDDEIAEKLGISADHLAMLRGNPHYEAVAAAVTAEAVRLSSPRTFDEWAADPKVEDRVASELLMTGLSTSSARDRVAALSAFADRRSAKKGREAEEAPAVSLPPNFVQAIMHVYQMAGSQGPAALPAGGGVDAGVLNVPKRSLPEGKEQ